MYNLIVPPGPATEGAATERYMFPLNGPLKMSKPRLYYVGRKSGIIIAGANSFKRLNIVHTVLDFI